MERSMISLSRSSRLNKAFIPAFALFQSAIQRIKSTSELIKAKGLATSTEDSLDIETQSSVSGFAQGYRPPLRRLLVDNLLESLDSVPASPNASGENDDDTSYESSASCSPTLSHSRSNRIEDSQDAVSRSTCTSTAPTASHGHQRYDRIQDQGLGRHWYTERCVVGTSRWDSRLPNDIWVKILPQLHSGDLACLALVCKELAVIVEAALYKRVFLLSPHRLVQFSETIQHKADKDYVRSVAVSWSQHGRIGGVTDTAFGEIMKHLHSAKIEHLEVFHESTTGTCESEITLPPRVRSLDTSAAFLRRIAGPLPPLRNLSIRLRESDLLSIHQLIGPLDGTLLSLRLRLERTSPFVQKRDNPVRLCARLGTRHLKYLEILEQRISTGPSYPAGHFDQISGTRFHHEASQRLRCLRRLVWMPVWSQGLEEDLLPGGQYHDTLAQFEQELLQVLALQDFILALPGSRCLRFVPSERSTYAMESMFDFEQWWQSVPPK